MSFLHAIKDRIDHTIKERFDLAVVFRRPPKFSKASSYEDMKNAFAKERCILIRDAVDPGLLDVMANLAQARYARWDKLSDENPEKVANENSRFCQGHIPASEIGSTLLEVLANETYLRQFIGHVCGYHTRFECPRDFLLRRMLPPPLQRADVVPKVAYHQDEYFALASTPDMAKPQLCFTAWVPLVACGVDAPGLTVVRKSDEPVMLSEPGEGWDGYVDRVYGADAIWSPAMRRGDVLFFTSRAIHGSHVTPQMTKPRYSVEIRGGINTFT